MLSKKEVSQHNCRHSCWVIVAGQAYDVTEFLDQHPGGAGVILQYAGRDATQAYEEIHPPGTIDQLAPEKRLGPLEASRDQDRDPSNDRSPVEEKPEQEIPNLHTLQNLDDFEHAAKQKLTTKAWVYYSSGADDLRTLERNREDWAKISFRPRVLRDVARVALHQSVMGHKSSIPVFIAPAAMAELGLVPQLLEHLVPLSVVSQKRKGVPRRGRLIFG